MANPNRVMAYLPKSMSDYGVTGSFAEANRCAAAFKEQGYKVRVTKFRSGSNKRRDYSYRVTVYFDDSQAEPDVMGWIFANRVWN